MMNNELENISKCILSVQPFLLSTEFHFSKCPGEAMPCKHLVKLRLLHCIPSNLRANARLNNDSVSGCA